MNLTAPVPAPMGVFRAHWGAVGGFAMGCPTALGTGAGKMAKRFPQGSELGDKHRRVQLGFLVTHLVGDAAADRWVRTACCPQCPGV